MEDRRNEADTPGEEEKQERESTTITIPYVMCQSQDKLKELLKNSSIKLHSEPEEKSAK